jgi:aminoglycoside phosphotransferase (APT) family kinase protein
LWERIRPQLDLALKLGQLSQAEVRRALDLLEPLLVKADCGKLYLSNDDFNFRNLIELPAGRVAVIDWDSSRVSSFEIEHCVTYLWMMMWNQTDWRKGLVSLARQRLPLDLERTRAVLLVNCLHQSMHVWRKRNDLHPIPLGTFRNVLEDAYFEKHWRFPIFACP